MVLISEVGAVQTTVEKNSTKRKKATSYHYPDDIIKVIYVVNNSYCSEESTINKDICAQYSEHGLRYTHYFEKRRV